MKSLLARQLDPNTNKINKKELSTLFRFSLLTYILSDAIKSRQGLLSSKFIH
ncbi:hypothetical protein HMPREF1240_0054 [Streptococcus pyogenes GA03455]|nr:hypothetical protein HMPREF1240_0054 [Streptococcus pyogenes GA03455]